ncbi:MAG: beta-ketoacyl-ACP synthase III [Armatimonadota bacterium]|nr:beta-ketoacyl-ACP synthase III [Armatimonadota bacterium]MDW8289840.1 beta-ketoacyl-ACP synthase III [Armatimonadota bacterium]
MPSKMRAGIVGVGVGIPEQVLTNHDLERRLDTSDEWIVTRTGIRERRIAPPHVATSDLAAQAAMQALRNAGKTPDEVDLIMVATATPDMPWPATACLVQAKIGASHAAAFDLNAVCSGFVYALWVAAQAVETGAYRCVLVIGADILSRQLNWEDRSTCVLFGDGAGAAVLVPVEEPYGVLSGVLGADGTGAPLLQVPAGGTREPITPEVLAQKRHTVYMRGREVFKFAVTIMGEVSLQALEKAGIPPEEVSLFIPHQANIRIIQAAAERLNLPMERVFVNLERYGNTSAASIPIALYEAWEGGRLRKGDVVVVVGFGAGLTWGACVLRWAY